MDKKLANRMTLFINSILSTVKVSCIRKSILTISKTISTTATIESNVSKPE